MFPQLTIQEVFQIIQNTPLSYIVFYYLILFVIASIIKQILNINIKFFNSELGIFKVDEKSIPILLLCGYFGLVTRFIRNLEIFEKNINLQLTCSLILILSVIFIQQIQLFIQKRDLTTTKKIKHKNYNEKSFESKNYLKYYREKTESNYKFLTINLLVIIFSTTFSAVEFGKLSTMLVLTLMAIYSFYVLYPKRKIIRNELNQYY